MPDSDSSHFVVTCRRHVFSQPITTRRSIARIILGAILCWATLPAEAQTNYYFGTSGGLTGATWSTNPAGPYTANLPTSGGPIINFQNPASFTGGSITVSAIYATANATLTSKSGTISAFSNGHVPINVAAGATLDFGTQNFSGSSTASYRKDGDGVLAFAGNNYGGGFTLNAGTVIVRGVGAFGNGGALTINGGTIAADGNGDLSSKYGGGIFIGGDFTLGGTTGLASSAADITFSNNVSLAGSTRKRGSSRSAMPQKVL